jgi:hypothetical protein
VKNVKTKFIYMFLLLAFSNIAKAADHVVASIKQDTINKFSNQILKENTSFRFRIDENHFLISKEEILHNNFIKMMNEFLSEKIQEQVKLHWESSSLKVFFNYGAQPFQARIIQKADKLLLKLDIDLVDFYINVAKFNICEKYNNRNHSCLPTEDQLFLKLRDVDIKKKSYKNLKISATSEIKIHNKKVKFKVLNIKTNLGEEVAASINIGDFSVPKPVLVINGEEYEFETSYLKDEVDKRKDQIASLMVEVASGFVSNKLVDLINEQVVNKLDSIELKKRLVDYYDEKKDPFSQYSFNRHHLRELQEGVTVAQDNTYVAPRYRQPLRTTPSQTQLSRKLLELSFEDHMSNWFKRTLYKTQIDIAYNSIQIPYQKDIVIGAKTNVILNNDRIDVSNRFLGGLKPFYGVEIEDYKKIESDFSFAISEPYINSLINLRYSKRILNQVLAEKAKVKGVRLSEVKLAFVSGFNYRNYVCQKACSSEDDSVMIVGKFDVDVDTLKTNTWLYRTLSAGVGSIVSDFEVPFILRLTPVLYKKGKDHFLTVKVHSIKAYPNTLKAFGIKLKDLTMIAAHKVNQILEKRVKPMIEEGVNISLSNYINTDLMSLRPQGLVVTDSGYLVLKVDIEKINTKKIMERFNQ